jgi:hypothetical protein
MFFWLIAMLLAVAPSEADEKTTADDGSAASSPVADKPALPETVELRDGADSAEGALTAFVAASKAADDQAALLMVDPPIRRLLLPEIAIEKFAMDSVLIEHALFGEEKNAVGGILFYCAQRELINIQSIEIINTSVVDADRVIFTILSTGLSYHHDGDMRIVQDLMAIRRAEKWYVFKLFGVMTNEFRENTDAANGAVALLHVKRGTEEMPNRRNADFELEFSVPFEKVHAELVRASESSDIAESIVLSDRLDRLRNSIVNRAKRGEYTTRAAVNAAFQQSRPMVDDILKRQTAALQSALSNLVKVNSSASPNPAHK